MRIVRIIIRIIRRLFAIFVSATDFLEKLQNKPKHVRIFILWTSVVISMTLLFVLWTWSLGGPQEKQSETISQLENQETKSFTELKKEIPSLWQSLKASLSGLFESASEGFEKQENQPKIEIESAEPESQDKVPPAELP